MNVFNFVLYFCLLRQSTMLLSLPVYGFGFNSSFGASVAFSVWLPTTVSTSIFGRRADNYIDDRIDLYRGLEEYIDRSVYIVYMNSDEKKFYFGYFIFKFTYFATPKTKYSAVLISMINTRSIYLLSTYVSKV